MADDIDMSVNVYHKGDLPELQLCIMVCCREWVCALGFPVGKCGLCGERPTFLRAERR